MSCRVDLLFCKTLYKVFALFYSLNNLLHMASSFFSYMLNNQKQSAFTALGKCSFIHFTLILLSSVDIYSKFCSLELVM